MAESSNPELCSICKENIDNSSGVSTLGHKGANGINAVSTQRCDRIVVEAGVKVYSDCRKTRQTHSKLKEN